MTPQELKDARLKLQLDQDQLGWRLGLSRVSISQMENGHQDIRESIALAIKAFLDREGLVGPVE